MTFHKNLSLTSVCQLLSLKDVFIIPNSYLENKLWLPGVRSTWVKVWKWREFADFGTPRCSQMRRWSLEPEQEESYEDCQQCDNNIPTSHVCDGCSDAHMRCYECVCVCTTTHKQIWLSYRLNLENPFYHSTLNPSRIQIVLCECVFIYHGGAKTWQTTNLWGFSVNVLTRTEWFLRD